MVYLLISMSFCTPRHLRSCCLLSFYTINLLTVASLLLTVVMLTESLRIKWFDDKWQRYRYVFSRCPRSQCQRVPFDSQGSIANRKSQNTRITTKVQDPLIRNFTQYTWWKDGESGQSNLQWELVQPMKRKTRWKTVEMVHELWYTAAAS